MNRGKSNNSQGIVDKLNIMLSRLMGKRSVSDFKKNTPKAPANQKFAAVFFVISFVLWMLTGVYYIPENQAAIFLHGGKVVGVSNGMTVKVDIPYPFSNVEMIDTSVNNISIGTESSPVTIINKDQVAQQIYIYSNYQVSDPQKYFLSFYQDGASLNKQVSLVIQEHIQRYFLNLTQDQFNDIGKSVSENEILSQVNLETNKIGIKISKLAIHFVSIKPHVEKVINRSSEPLSSQVIDTANKYSIWKTTQAKQMKADFDDLLPQYVNNHKTISELLYYRMVASVPESVNADFLSMDFIKTSSTESSLVNSSNDIRNVNRNVVRERSFEGR